MDSSSARSTFQGWIIARVSISELGNVIGLETSRRNWTTIEESMLPNPK